MDETATFSEHRGDREAAKDLTGRLIAYATEDREYQFHRMDIYVADVEAAVDRFASQLRALRRFNVGFPCLVFGDGRPPMPVDLGLVPLLPPWSLVLARLTGWQSLLADYVQLKAAKEIARFGIQGVPSEVAVQAFARRLEEFLVVRFSARQSDISESPGLQFRVATNTSGLRVHFSPAHSFNPTNVLGAPTTPVNGWLQPGWYVFGAARVGRRPVFDFTAEYKVPPDREAQLAT